MSKRAELKGEIFTDLWVLDFEKQKNSHALWKCLCMQCNTLVYVTATNLLSNNSKACASCGRKSLTYAQEFTLIELYRSGLNKSQIAKELHVNRSVVYRVIKKELPED